MRFCQSIFFNTVDLRQVTSVSVKAEQGQDREVLLTWFLTFEYVSRSALVTNISEHTWEVIRCNFQRNPFTIKSMLDGPARTSATAIYSAF